MSLAITTHTIIDYPYTKIKATDNVTSNLNQNFITITFIKLNGDVITIPNININSEIRIIIGIYQQHTCTYDDWIDFIISDTTPNLNDLLSKYVQQDCIIYVMTDLGYNNLTLFKIESSDPSLDLYNYNNNRIIYQKNNQYAAEKDFLVNNYIVSIYTTRSGKLLFSAFNIFTDIEHTIEIQSDWYLYYDIIVSNNYFIFVNNVDVFVFKLSHNSLELVLSISLLNAFGASEVHVYLTNNINHLIGIVDNQIVVYNIQSNEIEHKINFNECIYNINISNDNNIICINYHNQDITLYDFDKKKILYVIENIKADRVYFVKHLPIFISYNYTSFELIIYSLINFNIIKQIIVPNLLVLPKEFYLNDLVTNMTTKNNIIFEINLKNFYTGLLIYKIIIDTRSWCNENSINEIDNYPVIFFDKYMTQIKDS